MSVKTKALKRVAVALGYGSSVSEYSGTTVVAVLKEMAVKMQCAVSTAEIPYGSIVGVLNYIADNYGAEENEPYNLTKTETHATVTFKRNNKTLAPGNDILYNGDKIKITAAGATGYDLTTLTVNGTAFTNGNEYTVNGHNVAVVATGTEKEQFNITRVATRCTVTVTRGGTAIADGTKVLTEGDVITITAVADSGKTMSTLDVNGQPFTSGNTLTVADDVLIIATAN